MIPCLLNLRDIDKIIRSEIITQSELNSERVLNALSIRGVDLEKLVTQLKYTSIDTADILILFEVENRDDGYNETYSYPTYVESYSSYRVNIIIYGNNSKTISQKLKARFETMKVRERLQEQGIYLEGVSKISSINEYMNETMWLRSDLSFDISCLQTYPIITPGEQVEDIGDLKITKR